MNRTRIASVTLIPALLCLVAATLSTGPARAGKSAPFTARAGLDIAADAAHSWAPDARLIYLENDEIVAGNGAAVRWGYLFFSPRKGKARGYSVRDGKILEAADLGFDFEAPPLPDEWIDSERALAAADKKAGAKYRRDHGGHLDTMMLIRGAFHDKTPNAATWALLYTSDSEPALVVVVDASKGEVVRTWRG